MLSGAVVLEFVQAIAGRIAQVVECLRPVQHFELVERTTSEVCRDVFAPQSIPDPLGLGARVGEGADHLASVRHGMGEDDVRQFLRFGFGQIEWQACNLNCKIRP